ncbi:myb-related transcription factor, partner of profilin-like [Bicyclus anynana]|uniref:Regulatory protein zeste n=1 Tax=Bicyclus anynana TaxID=110368 RepID=A0ABM3M1U7_BICAN|nr:myb-related transcription factor, partner of profilin-like [Bicyclus anynana]
MAETSRRRVSYGQLEQLWEFLNANKGIATGYNKTSQARDFSKRMWENIAQNLNSHGDGAIKDWKGWSKYWNDYKSKLKKLAVAARASHQQTGGGAPLNRALTEIENKFLYILGEDFGSGLPGIRVEPLETLNETTNFINSEATNSVVSESILDLPMVILEEEPGPGPSSSRLSPPQPDSHPLPTSPPLPTTPPRAVTPRPVPISTPRRSPRRRRRRVTPLTQDAARRELIRISDRRAEIEEANRDTLIKLLEEIRGIKEMLLSRYVERPRDEV